MTPFTLSSAQLQLLPYRVEENRQKILLSVENAFRSGSKVVVLPELCVTGYGCNQEQIRDCAEPIDGYTSRSMTSLARKFDAMVVYGFAESNEGGLYNSAVIVSKDGVILHYRKLHLFDQEKHCFRPGDLGLPVVDTPLGKIGVCVCYDLRFVEVLRIMALSGAELICVPTAWVSGFDKPATNTTANEPTCRQAREVVLQANLNQVFIACASVSGVTDNYRFLGNSLIVDPNGEILTGPGDEETESVHHALIDISEVEKAKIRGPLIQPRADRRTDVYRICYDNKQL